MYFKDGIYNLFLTNELLKIHTLDMTGLEDKVWF